MRLSCSVTQVLSFAQRHPPLLDGPFYFAAFVGLCGTPIRRRSSDIAVQNRDLSSVSAGLSALPFQSQPTAINPNRCNPLPFIEPYGTRNRICAASSVPQCLCGYRLMCSFLHPKPIISRPAAGRQPILNRYQWRLFAAIIAYYRLLSPNRDFCRDPAHPVTIKKPFFPPTYGCR
jgi:hypothetical protein